VVHASKMESLHIMYVMYSNHLSAGWNYKVANVKYTTDRHFRYVYIHKHQFSICRSLLKKMYYEDIY